MKLKTCCHCKQEKLLDEFGRETRRINGHKDFCLLCAKIIRRNQYNGKIRVADTLRWRAKPGNHQRCIDQWRRYRAKLKTQVVAAYGGCCTCCGENEMAFLTIEHLNGGGLEHRKRVGSGSGIYRDIIRQGFPTKFTVLCMNCNFAKRWGKTCPHQQALNLAEVEK